MDKKEQAVKTSRDLIADEGFKCRHRWAQQAFTRVRSLSFGVVLVMVLRNSVKSLQNAVNEAMSWLGTGPVSGASTNTARLCCCRTSRSKAGDESAEG